MACPWLMGPTALVWRSKGRLAVGERLALVVAVLLVAGVVAVLLDRRRSEPPTRDSYETPRQLDRSDFPRPEARLLVVVFTSATCDSCAKVLADVSALGSDSVAVCEVEAVERADLHRRYRIDAVPLTVIAEHEGVVQAAWVGPVAAGELEAAVVALSEDSRG